MLKERPNIINTANEVVKNPAVIFKIEPQYSANLIERLGNEGYFLHITDQQILLTAGQSTGLFYGVETLLQLAIFQNNTGVEGYQFQYNGLPGPGFEFGIAKDVNNDNENRDEKEREIGNAADENKEGGEFNKENSSALIATFPGVEIEDWPKYQWRGMLLDVSRHFSPVSFVKRYLDLLAIHKMNRYGFKISRKWSSIN